MASAKNQVNDSWKSTCEAFSKWRKGEAVVEQKKARDEYAASHEKKQTERAERKSKISEAWAANRSKNST